MTRLLTAMTLLPVLAMAHTSDSHTIVHAAEHNAFSPALLAASVVVVGIVAFAAVKWSARHK